MNCSLLWLSLLPCFAAQDFPMLSRFTVKGTLFSNVKMDVPFDPPFKPGRADVGYNFRCQLDFAMRHFTLTVDSRPPSVLSKIARDGSPVPSRVNLTNIELLPGQQTDFEIGVTNKSTVIYTLIVIRRHGSSLELLGLRPMTANLTIPFHPGELQGLFQMQQSLHEDYFVVDYDFADGGQNITCSLEKRETFGSGKPSDDSLAEHEFKYKPSLEELNGVEVRRQYNPNSPGAGPTDSCRVPIDTWREIRVGLHITSADRASKRVLHMVVKRKGCEAGSFFYQGRCKEYCPSRHYEQRFNWRCGECNTYCQFCEHWHHCLLCQRNSSLQRFVNGEDGTCRALRVHPYRVYYEIFYYLAVACSALSALYCTLLGIWMCKRLCSSEQQKEELGEEDLEEVQPLTDRGRWHYYRQGPLGSYDYAAKDYAAAYDE